MANTIHRFSRIVQLNKITESTCYGVGAFLIGAEFRREAIKWLDIINKFGYNSNNRN